MRHFLLLWLLLCALPFAAGAQTLTEAEALRLGLSRAELHDIERGTRALAEFEVTAAGTRPSTFFHVVLNDVVTSIAQSSAIRG